MYEEGKIKLLLIAPVPPPYGGIANWVMLLKEYLKEKEEVDLIDILNIAPKQRELDGRTLYDRVVVQGLEMIKLGKKLKKIICKKNPTVAHLTTSGQLAIIRDIFLLKILKKKKISSVYHIRFGRIPEIEKRNTFEWKIIKKAIELSDKVIAIDKKTEIALKKHFEKDKIVLIPNPFVTESIEKYKNQENTKTVMFLGWCIKTKGIEELMSAWVEVEKIYPEWQLRLVGPYDISYKKEVEKKYISKKIFFDGEKEHEKALEILSNSEIFVLPSYTEGFPNAVLEAMAMKKPIIATDVGAIPEMLSENCGIIIKSRNTEDLKLALLKVIENKNLRNRIAENAHAKIKNQYDINVIYKKYLSIWKGEKKI